MISRRRHRKLKRRLELTFDPVTHEFTRKRRGIILRALEARLPRNRAAGLSGITYAVFRTWMDKGLECQDDNSLPINSVFVSFRKRVLAIDAKHERESLRRIELAGKGGRRIKEVRVRVKTLGKFEEREVVKVYKEVSPIWQADAWYLERTKRGEYGREALNLQRETTPEEDAKAIKDAADALFDSVPGEEGI